MKDDTISRQEAIEAFSKELCPRDGVIAVGLTLDGCKDILETLAAVQSREPAEWIWKLADNGWADWTCSNCGYTENTDIHVHLDWKYCPNCGRYIKNRHRKDKK